MRRRLRRRQAAKNSSRHKDEDESSQDSEDSEALHTEIDKDGSALENNAVRRRSLRLRQTVDKLGLRLSMDKLDGNEENRSQETTLGPSNTAVDENVLLDNAVRRRSLRLRQTVDKLGLRLSVDKLDGNEENRSQETTLGPSNNAVDENVLLGSVERRRSVRFRQSLDTSYGTGENRSQETTVGSNFLPNNTAVDENVLKGLRRGWWRDLQDSHSTNAIPLSPSPFLGDTRYDCAENPPQGWYQHLDLTEIPSFRRTSDGTARSSGIESYRSPDTASSPKLHKRPLRQKITSVINVGDFQDAYDLEDSKHLSNTRSKPLQTSSRNSRTISHENNLTKTKNSNSVHSSIFSDTDESPVRKKRPLRRDSKFPSDYQNFDAVLEGSDIEIQDPIISTKKAQIDSVNVSNNVDDHSVSTRDGVTDGGQSSPPSLRNTNLRIVGHRPFAQKRKRKSSLYKNLNFVLEDDVESSQGDEIHTKSSSMHSSPLSESTNSPIKYTSKPLRKNRSEKLSNGEDFTKTYEDDTKIGQVKDRYKTLDDIMSLSDSNDDNQKERPDKLELDKVSNKDHEISHNKRSQKSIGSSILLHSTESPVLPNSRPFKKRLKMVGDYQVFEEALEDSDYNDTHRDKVGRSGQDELSLKRVASYEGPSNLDQISETSKDLQNIEEDSPTTSVNVSSMRKMVYNPFAQKKGRKSSVYRGLELVLEENSDSSQTRAFSRKSISVSSSVPSESSGSPSKKISGSPTKKVAKIFQKNKSASLLNERDLATAFEDNSSGTDDRNESKRVTSVDGDDNVASPMNRAVFEKSVQSNIPSDTTGSPLRTNIRPFKKNSKIIADYQHFEEALDISDSRASDKNKSRKSRGTTSVDGDDNAASPTNRTVFEKYVQSNIPSDTTGSPFRTNIRPFKKNSKIVTDYQHFEEALDISDSRASDKNKSRKSRGTTSVDGDDNVASPMNHTVFEKSVQSNIPSDTTGSPIRTNIRPFKKNSKIVTDYQHFEEVLDINDSRASDKKKSRKSRGSTSIVGDDNVASPKNHTVFEKSVQSNIPSDTTVSPFRTNIRPFKKNSKIIADYQHFEEALNINDSRAPDKKKSRKSRGTTSVDGDDNVVSPMNHTVFEKSVQSNIPSDTTGSPVRTNIRPFEKNSKIVTDYQHFEEALDINDSRASDKNKSRKSRGTTSVDGDDNVASPTNRTVFEKSVQSNIPSDTTGSPLRTNIRPFKKNSKIITDYQHFEEALDISDSRASHKNKSRKSRGTTSVDGDDNVASPTNHTVFEKSIQSNIPSDTTGSPFRTNIRPFKKNSKIVTDYQHFEEALDISDARASDKNKSRKSRGTTSVDGNDNVASPTNRTVFEKSVQSNIPSDTTGSPLRTNIRPFKKNSKIVTDYQHSDGALDIIDSRTSSRNKSSNSQGTTGGGPSTSGSSRQAAMLVEQSSLKEVSSSMQSSVSNTSPADRMINKPLMRKKSRKSFYKNLELALQEKSSSESDETPRESSSVHSSYFSEKSKSSVRNVPNNFPKNKSVVLSGLSTAFESVSQSSNAVEGTKFNKEESDSLQSNIVENSRKSAALHNKKTVSERSISSNTPSDTTESPLQKKTNLASGNQDLNESLEDSDLSMFDRRKITRSKTSMLLEHHEHTSDNTLEHSVRALSQEVEGEMELSSLSSTSTIGNMRHQPFRQKKIGKSSIYRGVQLVLDEKAEYSHKTEVHRIGSSRSSLPSESSGSPIKTTSKPFQKNKSVFPSYERDLEAVFEDDSDSPDIVDNNGSKRVRFVDGNDIESSQDRLYNRQLIDNIVPQQTEDMPVKNSQQNVVSSMNRALFDKYIQSNIHSDTNGSPDRTNMRVLEKNSKITTDHERFEDLDSSDSSVSGKQISKKSYRIVVETGGTISTEPLYIEEPVINMSRKRILTEDTPLPSGLPSESSGSPTKMVSKISEKNKSIILSNENDLPAAFEDGSYADSDDIEPSQDGQHSSHLSGNNKNVFSKQSEEISAKNSRHSVTSSMNHTVSHSLVQSNIPSDNTGSPIANNQNFERTLDRSDSIISARNKSRKSDQVQQEPFRQKDMYNIQPSVSNASPARNISLMQNNSQKSVSKSLKFAVEENTVFSQTSKSHQKSTSAQSNLPSQNSEYANNKFANTFHNNKSVISNEADFAAILDEDIDSSDTTVENTSIPADIETSLDRQHSNQLRIINENSHYMKQVNTDMKRGHQDSESSDCSVIVSSGNSQSQSKNVQGSHSNGENSSKNTSENKMPSRSQVLVKQSQELEMSFSSNSEPAPVANSTPVIRSPAKKMKYTAATIPSTGGSSSPSSKQRSFLQKNETSKTFPFMGNDKSHRQSQLSQGTNMKSPRVVNVKQQFSQDSSPRKIGNNADLHHSSGLVAKENDSGNKDIAHNDISVNKSKDQFEPSPIVRTNIKKSISRFRLTNKKNEVGKSPIKRTSGSLLSKGVSEATKNTDEENSLSLRAKGHTNDVSGLSRSLQKNQDLEKAKEMNQKRMKKIEENLHKEQKKPRTIQEYFEALKIANNQKPKKPPISKPIDPDFLVDGKVYHPPPFKKPRAWVSKQLINAVLKHCEKKYGPITKRRKAEQFMGDLCEQVSNAMKRSKNYPTSVENTKEILYKFGLIKNLHDFYCFTEDYLPSEFRVKAIPCLRAFGKTTGPPWIPGTNIYQELEFD